MVSVAATEKADVVTTRLYLNSLHRSIGIKEESEGSNGVVAGVVCHQSGHGDDEDGQIEGELPSSQHCESNNHKHHQRSCRNISEGQSGCSQDHILQYLSNFLSAVQDHRWLLKIAFVCSLMFYECVDTMLRDLSHPYITTVHSDS